MLDFTIQGSNDTRSGFGEGLLEAGKNNPKVVGLCADLIGSLKMDAFQKAFPERFFQVGIAEANMMGVAAGLTVGGFIPFTGTFANFSTGRVYDQIRQSIAYSDKNVKICASHAGLTLGEDGATHQILEDIGTMTMLPNMTVINPCDFNQTKAIVDSARKTGAVVTAEEHQINGGMGSLVAQALAMHCPTPIEFVGVNDSFGESGTPDQLMKKYGLESENIIAAVKKVLKRKSV